MAVKTGGFILGDVIGVIFFTALIPTAILYANSSNITDPLVKTMVVLVPVILAGGFVYSIAKKYGML